MHLVGVLVSTDPSRSPVTHAHIDDPGVREYERHLEELYARGCVARCLWRSDEGRPVGSYTINDLGRLALRVSVPGAPVPT